MPKIQVLIVEDESIVALDIQSMLGSLGYEVPAVVSSGEAAIEKAAETHPDLVLMDIRLKGDMDGIEAAEQIRGRFNIPVVYLTAYADDETLQRAKITEPYGYILKPFGERELHTAIEIALHKHKLERELQESEKRYRLLAENVTDVIWTMDMNLRYTYISPSVSHQRGYRAEEMMTRTLEETLTPASYEVFMKTFAAELELEKMEQKDPFRSQTLELEQICKDGSTVRTEVKMSFLRDEDGRATGILGVTRDITKRKRAEEEREHLLNELEAKNIELEKAMEHMANLEEVTRMKSDFLSITSHELRTPLTPMKAQLQMLQEGYMGELNAKQGKSMGVVLRNLTRLDKLIADILDISRIEAGRIKMVFKPMSFNDVVKEAIRMQEHSAEAQNIGISAELADLPPIIGDVERLRQVIGNLISNAIKFSESSGKLIIETKRSDLDGRESIQFSITDYGIGISKEDQTKLFKPFSQIDTSAGREHVGTGLGLAIAKGIIHAHEGKIWVESELGKGSTFYSAIPIKQEITKKEVSYL